jgi:hypothetical protein
MKTILIALTGVLVGTSMLPGQEPTFFGRAYQVFGQAPGIRALDEGFNNQVVRGKPFSATEERRSLQVLQNGTRIENNQTNRLFRDSQGRTRVEEMNGTTTIFDPVANSRVELDPAAKTARRVAGYQLALNAYQRTVGNKAAAQADLRGVQAETVETLNPQVVNGVLAQGTRTAMTIPKGQIGNDREIKVITERWVSNDLQMLIKSTNSDPRFGDTSYQLTGIVEREPDASLFQIPAGYTEIGVGVIPAGGRGPAGPGGRGTPGGRGGRGGAPDATAPGRF